MLLIGINGKKQHGKDTLSQLIKSQIYSSPKYPEQIGNIDIKKFADKLKYIVCILIGCNIEQLEDNTFKETPLGPEWTVWYWQYKDYLKKKGQRFGKLFMSYEECQAKSFTIEKFKDVCEIVSEVLTPRRLLQLLGTECGREIIHPNIWVNALMKDYVPQKTYLGHGDYKEYEPDWIITDVRFENEVNAIKAKGGLIIRINRTKRTSDRWQEMYPAIKVLDPDGWNRKNYQFSWFEEYIDFQEYKNRVLMSTCMTDMSKCIGWDSSDNREQIFEKIFKLDEHESEIALDNYTGFDAIISNDGGFEQLQEKTKQLLHDLKIL